MGRWSWMRKRSWTVLLASLLIAAHAVALEPDDVVIGVGTSLYTVDPLTGTLDLLSEGPTDLGSITGIAVRPDGLLFFTQTTAFTGISSVWRLDPQTGERSAIYSPGHRFRGLAMDRLGNLVVPVVDASPDSGFQEELIWLDSETGEEVLVIPLKPEVFGLPFFLINDVAVDREGRALVSTSFGIIRVDPRTGGLERLGSAGSRSIWLIAVEADGSILVTQRCLILHPLPCSASLIRTDPDSGLTHTVSMLPGGLALGIAFEADGGILVSTVPVRGDPGLGSIVRVDPDDGSQTLVVGDLPTIVGAIGVVPHPEVRIDVRPSRLRIGAKSRGMLPVVVFGSERFDVEGIDLDGLGFGPSGASPLTSRVVQRGADAFPDLLLFFRADQAGFRPGDTRACLYGTANGVPFLACDKIQVIGG